MRVLLTQGTSDGLETYFGGRANWSTQAPSFPPELPKLHLPQTPTHLLAHKETGSHSQSMSEVVYGVGQQVEIATDLGERRESQAELGRPGELGRPLWVGQLQEEGALSGPLTLILRTTALRPGSAAGWAR